MGPDIHVNVYSGSLSHGSWKTDKLSNNFNYSHLFAPSTSHNMQSTIKNDASRVLSTGNNGGLSTGEASLMDDSLGLPNPLGQENETNIIVSNSKKQRGPNRGVALEEHYKTKATVSIDPKPGKQIAACSNLEKTSLVADISRMKKLSTIELYKEEFTDNEKKWVSEDCQNKMMEIRDKIIDDGGIVDEAPGSRVLYLGAVSGTTISHVSNIVGLTSMVYALEFSNRSGRDLVNMAKKCTNVILIIEDGHPTEYHMLVGMVDVIFSNVAQPDQCFHLCILYDA
ncbi:uncharacterized protein LOC110096623 [Dendrobium catenatum]|uniref:uncharacterized protein LOC110096623 n=1 Tax=Dendrobium catenatum TaxID=906689 RepID=UPI0009F56037|nr:uncharacterized protein LOC110096623 [Dendrobium catenatum]